jgi:hypothetical protein
VAFGKDVLTRGTAEVGMHLHAWNSPPIVPLTNDDYRYQPFLMEYPADLVHEKVHVITSTLEETFAVKMRSHRAGRWGLDETYANALIGAGYEVDCSVTPHVDWRSNLGDPKGKGGSDFRHFPEAAYFMDPRDISRSGGSPLLQVPMTIVRRFHSQWARALRASVRRLPLVRRYVYRSLPAHSWLRPTGRNGPELQRVLSIAEEQSRDYVEFMLHSSELMPGGSPTFRGAAHIEALYDDLESLFEAAARHWTGRTLSEYRATFEPSDQTISPSEPR